MRISMKKKAVAFFKEPRLIVKDTGKYGLGVFAGEDIKKGQTIKVLSGEVITFDECIKRIKSGEEAQTDTLQIGLELDMDLDDLSRTFNHSCTPNAGLRNISELFALEDISAGQEITYDYSATVGPNVPASVWTMQCHCGSRQCRKVIGNVLSLPDAVLERYKKLGALQDYILAELKKITKLPDGKYKTPRYKKYHL